jgi:TetR/AcrR family transcriptional regulator
MSYIAERRQEEKVRRRNEIVDAAEALYREIGWDAVTMDAVARRARLSRALVYVYFKDKRDLHFAIVNRAIDELAQRFTEAADSAANGAAKVLAIGRAYMRFSEELPHYFDACARLELHTPGEVEPTPQEQLLYEHGMRPHEVVIRALEAGQLDGSIRKDLGDLRVMARVLWGFSHGLMQIARTKRNVLARVGIDTDQLTNQALDLLTFALTGKQN